MANILKFNAAEVRRVVEHALLSKDWDAPIIDLDPTTHKEIYGKAEPCIILVHDEGVYLMSNGKPGDMTEKERHFAAYAEGHDPRKDDTWDADREAVGGDDFAIHLRWCQMVRLYLDAGATHISIQVSPTKLQLIVPAVRPKTGREKVKA